MTYARHTAITDFTVQDDTGGVWMLPMRLPEDCRVGAKVDVEGYVEPGSLWPVVRVETIRSLGSASLPEAKAATFEELLSGMVDGLRVEVTGVVRNQRVNPELGLNWLVMEIVTGGGRFTAHFTYEITGHPELVGALVRLKGVCLNSADPRRQAFLPRLNLPRLDDLEVLHPAADRPFELPVRALNHVLRPSIESEFDQRVRVRGTVTLRLPNGDFFLQDETRGLLVCPTESNILHPGEVVDVVGFPEPGEISPILRDADWRLENIEQEVEPLPVNALDAVEHDGQLVIIRCRLVDRTRTELEEMLTLEAEGGRFVARLPRAVSEASSSEWRNGCELALIGVCAAQVGSWERYVSERRPQTFQLLLRSTADVTLLRQAPIPPAKRIAWTAGALGAVVLATFAVLQVRTRRRMREQAQERIAAKTQFKAVLAERNRMAREIHDTLAQGFVVISAHLEALNDQLSTVEESRRTHLDAARELARENLEEARRTVWNMRSQALESGDLAAALTRLGRQLTSGTATTLTVRTHGSTRRLSPEVENNLLRIGQEALANGAHHAQAPDLKVDLEFTPEGVSLRITDNGSGFDVASANRERRLGLVSMRERCEEIGGTFRIDSAPGSGTKIEVTVQDV